MKLPLTIDRHGAGCLEKRLRRWTIVTEREASRHRTQDERIVLARGQGDQRQGKLYRSTHVPTMKQIRNP
mgnify:CR=1 FL=1